MKKLFGLLMLPAVFAFIVSDKYTLKGKITNESGVSIGFAFIIIKGTNIGTTAKSDGRFKLQNISGKETIVISGAGFESKEVKLNGQKEIKIILKTSSVALQEIVVASAHGVKRSTRMNVDYSVAAPLAGSAIAYERDNGVYKNVQRSKEDFNREGYEFTAENEFMKVNDNPLSTFSIDVDAASYSNVRRILKQGQLPPAGAVRIEEMINYFSYNYAQPTNEYPFAVATEMQNCPWNTSHKLLMIGLQGKKISYEKLPASNLVFLVDVSGSMMSPQKLPLVKASLKLLTDQLREEDKVAIVVYAGNAGLVLPSTSGSDKIRIKAAIDALEAGGSTAGGAGIKLAYNTAAENLVKNGNNRVILCTDGDFNVGASSDDELVRMIEEKRNTGIYLTVLGYGMGNYQDAKMQKLADKGNGNHHYIDELKEAQKVLVNEFGGTLFTIAKDVKLQVEFNPSFVQGYRLIGYENRMLAKEDFNDDKKDAGEMGSGHTVTALYEIIPADIDAPELRKTDDLKYQKVKQKPVNGSSEWANVKVRYKEPANDKSVKFEVPVKNTQQAITENFILASGVAEFGLLLTNSKFKSAANYEHLTEKIKRISAENKNEYVKELNDLIKAAQTLADKGLANRNDHE
jgi:Ca-activated chloride channel homolog